MRRVGTPITIRVDDAVIKLAKREADILKVPFRSHLRKLIEDHYRQTFMKPLSSVTFDGHADAKRGEKKCAPQASTTETAL